MQKVKQFLMDHNRVIRTPLMLVLAGFLIMNWLNVGDWHILDRIKEGLDLFGLLFMAWYVWVSSAINKAGNKLAGKGDEVAVEVDAAITT